MNYMGGKFRQGKKIAEYVMRVWKPGVDYYEPFCGALGSAYQVVQQMIDVNTKRPSIFLSDQHDALINMWNAILGGWEPPDVITEEMYCDMNRIRDPINPLTAYCGYGMSFGSKWFGGYARNGRGTEYAINLQRSTHLKAMTMLKAMIILKTADYESIRPCGSLIYLDPPYKNRTKQRSFKFDHDVFWQYAREMVSNNIVLVTEFIVPDDFVVLHNFGDTVVRHYSGKPADGTREVLVCHKSQLYMWELK